jgi:hypothetical protein
MIPQPWGTFKGQGQLRIIILFMSLIPQTRALAVYCPNRFCGDLLRASRGNFTKRYHDVPGPVVYWGA